MPELTAERLRELLHYNPETGLFTQRVVRQGVKAAGIRAGTINARGYVMVSLDNRKYSAHRLAWLYVTGSWPSSELDHRDGVPHNNRFSNLREVTRSQNLQNRRLSKSNSSGFRGVYWNKRAKQWHSQIRCNKKRIHLGFYDTASEAYAAYLAAAARLHTHNHLVEKAVFA